MSADHVSVSMPSAPAFETAAASRGTATIGARTIGCSIPSNSHTGVVNGRHPFVAVSSYDVGTAPGDRRSQPWNFE